MSNAYDNYMDPDYVYPDLATYLASPARTSRKRPLKRAVRPYNTGVLVARFVCGREDRFPTVKAAAQALGRAPGTVCNWLHRGLTPNAVLDLGLASLHRETQP